MLLSNMATQTMNDTNETTLLNRNIYMIELKTEQAFQVAKLLLILCESINSHGAWSRGYKPEPEHA